MHKKFTLVIMGCLCSLFSFSQIKKGTISPNFNVGDFGSMSLSKDNLNVSFNPGVGYFLTDNLEAGISFNYHRFHIKSHLMSPYYQLENGNTIGVDLYTNLYFGKGKFKPYITLRGGWDRSQWSITANNTTTHFNQRHFVASIGAGVNWQIRPRFSIFAEGGLRRMYPLNYDSYNRSEFFLTVGMRFYFNQKKKFSNK